MEETFTNMLCRAFSSTHRGIDWSVLQQDSFRGSSPRFIQTEKLYVSPRILAKSICVVVRTFPSVSDRWAKTDWHLRSSITHLLIYWPMQTQTARQNSGIASPNQDISMMDSGQASSPLIQNGRAIPPLVRNSIVQFEPGRSQCSKAAYCWDYLNLVLFMLYRGDNSEGTMQHRKSANQLSAKSFHDIFARVCENQQINDKPVLKERTFSNLW
jgi:hypothetical protein